MRRLLRPRRTENRKLEVVQPGSSDDIIDKGFELDSDESQSSEYEFPVPTTTTRNELKAKGKANLTLSKTCSVCGKEFSLPRLRIVHEFNACGVPFDEEKLKHELKGSKLKFTKCTFPGCERICYESSLKSHLNVHTGEQIYDCQYCGKPFRHVSSWKLHEQVICARSSGDICNSIVNSIASDQMTNKDKVNNKITVKHKLSTTCSVCGKTFTALRLRLVHEFNVCGVPYDEEKLKEELKGRSKIELTKCTYPGCELVCYKGSSFQRHLELHTGEHLYQCQYCGKSFKQESNRKQHELYVCKPDPSVVSNKSVRRPADSLKKRKKV